MPAALEKAQQRPPVSETQTPGIAQPSPILNVAESVRGFCWVDRLPVSTAAAATAIAQHHDLPELLGRVLAARGVAASDADRFLSPTIKELMPDPSRLQDMDKAASRIADAFQSNQPVAVFGDYDVDGACSAALVAKFCQHHGVACRIHIPDRMLEGYGPNAAALTQLMDDGAELIFTVDCGTTGAEAFAVAEERNIDVVVIDHHQADETLPPVHAVVNPNRQDDMSEQGHLCAAGVVFLALVAVTRELKSRGYYAPKDEAQNVAKTTAASQSRCLPPDLLQLLDLVALATIADVVPLQGLNRAFVTKGLQVMHRRHNVGLKALADAAGIAQAPTPYHLGYILGPRINAGGRIGDAALGAKLLSGNDAAQAAEIAQRLDKLNRERKEIETGVLELAVAACAARLEDTPELPMLLVAGDDWHKGVVGLVASRLVERFQRPACVIGWDSTSKGPETTGTGSLRSVAGVDIGAAVRKAVDKGLLTKGGGHAMAAGLTVTRANLPAVQGFLTDEIAAASTAARATPTLELDGALTPAAATADLVALLERAGPYGQGNPQPAFAFPSVHVKFAKIVGSVHVRCSLQASDGSRIDAIAFRAADQPLGELLLTSSGMPIHVAGQLRRNTWGGREKIELQISDAAPLKPNT